MLQRPVDESGRRITDAVNVRIFDRLDVLPADVFHLGGNQIGIRQVDAGQIGPLRSAPVKSASLMSAL